MKKILIIGAIALVVVGCILAAGCTSTTTTNTPATTEDFAVGTWTMDDGTIAFFTNDFKGVVTDGNEEINFTWNKTTDGKYELINENGSKTTMTLDNVKGTMKIANGDVLTKITSNISGAISSEDDSLTRVRFYGNESTDGNRLFIRGIGIWRNNQKDPVGTFSDNLKDQNKDYCLGYYTEPEGGVMVFDRNFNFADDNIPGYVENGKWAHQGEQHINDIFLYGHYSDTKLS